MHDLLTDARYLWEPARNFVELDPTGLPAHVFAVEAEAAVAPRRLPPMSALERPSPGRSSRLDDRRDPLWYKDARHLRAARPRLPRQQRRRHRRLPGPAREARLPPGPRRHRALAAAVLPLAAARRRLRHRRLQPASTRPTARSQDFRRVPARGPPPRPAGHHRAGAQPHLRPAPLVPAGPRRARRVGRTATSTSGATRRTATATRASSSRTSRPRTGPGTRSPKAYYWHRFYSHQPDLNFDNPEVQQAMLRRRRLLARAWASTACGSTPCPTSTSARARTARTCPRRTRS